jgi:hypothetical protein
MSVPKFSDLTISNYSERSVVVRGNTQKYKEDLKMLGGKYNSRLRDESSDTGRTPGWIFMKSKEEDIKNFIRNGQRLSSERSGSSEYSSGGMDRIERLFVTCNKLTAISQKLLSNQEKIISLLKDMDLVIEEEGSELLPVKEKEEESVPVKHKRLLR